jgi:hypothetical protein
VLNNKTEVLPFLEKNFSRHLQPLLSTIKDCKKNKKLTNIPFPLLLLFMGINMVGPNIVLTILEQTKLSPPMEVFKKAIIPLLLSDRMIKARLDLVLKALAPEK